MVAKWVCCVDVLYHGYITLVHHSIHVCIYTLCCLSCLVCVGMTSLHCHELSGVHMKKKFNIQNKTVACYVASHMLSLVKGRN